MVSSRYFILNAFLAATLSLFFTVMVAVPEAQANKKFAALVIDAETGKVLLQENAGKHRHPASLTKMMTLYMTFRAIERGKLRMNQRISVSRRAAKQLPSKIGFKPGQTITVRDAILALVIKSANDVAYALGEAIAGTEWRFAKMMTQMAGRLGMKHTQFQNASGLHHARQKTTAYDMAKLAIALRRDYRKYYHLFKRSRFSFRGRTYVSHNNVTKNYKGADGIKTGYVNASGYNLVTSATRGNIKLVGVVLGGQSSKRRDAYMTKILDKGFVTMRRYSKKRQELYNSYKITPRLKPSYLKRSAKSTVASKATPSQSAYPVPSLKPLAIKWRSVERTVKTQASGS